MSFNITNASNILKIFYVSPLQEQLNHATVLLDRIGREDNIPVQGKTFTVPLHTTRNKTAGSGRADEGTLPTAGQQGYQVAVVPAKYIYGRIQISGPTIAATKSNTGAFVRALDSEIRGLERNMKRSVNRQLHSDGTDPLAFWTAADNTSGTNVDDGQGNAFVHLDSGATTVDVIDASDHSTVLGDSIVLTLGAEAAANYAVTWTGTVAGSADGDYAVMEDTLGNQLMGIRGIIDNADPPNIKGGLASGLHGLAVATYPWWTAAVYANSGTNRALSFALMQKPLSKIAISSDFGEDGVKFLMSNVFVRDEYVKLCLVEKRFVNKLNLDGGWEGIEFNGKPYVVDPQCRRNVIYYVTPETMSIFRMADFSFMERDGSMFSRVSNTDAYEAVMFAYMDLGCRVRNGNGILKDITES